MKNKNRREFGPLICYFHMHRSTGLDLLSGSWFNNIRLGLRRCNYISACLKNWGDVKGERLNNLIFYTQAFQTATQTKLSFWKSFTVNEPPFVRYLREFNPLCSDLTLAQFGPQRFSRKIGENCNNTGENYHLAALFSAVKLNLCAAEKWRAIRVSCRSPL